MKPLALFLLLLATLTACSPKIQVVTLRGSNVRSTDEGLVLDNDTLTLRYNFASERGLMTISLANKLNRPLYVDWKRSSFIIGQKTFYYWDDVANVNLATSGYTYRYGKSNVSSTSSSTAGTISKDLPVAFIPPHTKIDKRQFIVFPYGTVPTPGTSTVIQESARGAANRKKSISVRINTYSADQSPLTFRNYLTLSTNKDFNTEFYIDTQFWASDIRVEAESQAVDVITQKSDNSYVNAKSFAQKDGFYIVLPKKE